MTTLLQKAIHAVSHLPEEEQDRIAARILDEVGVEQTGEEPADWPGQAIREATGRATRGLTTDEILALTRDDD